MAEHKETCDEEMAPPPSGDGGSNCELGVPSGSGSKTGSGEDQNEMKQDNYEEHFNEGAKEDHEMTVNDQCDFDDDIYTKAFPYFMLLEDGIINESVEEKCAWLRSQLVGDDVEFDTPFGKRRLTYADHTATGRCLHSIENYIVENVLPFYGNTHTNDSFVGRQMTKMVHEAAKYIKSSMGGGPEDAILFCGSGTTAAIKRLQEVMGISIPSIMKSRASNSLEEKEKWVVFVGPYEHHSNLLSWRQSLAEVVEIGDMNGFVDMGMLQQELRSHKYSGRPKLGSFSACSNVTGIYTDTTALARLLHENGAFACFDFSASGPNVQIDLRSGELEGYDAVFLSPHKFVGGPGTPGILLMSKTLYCLGSDPPSTCGGGTVAFVNGFNEMDTLYHEDIEEREDAGTPAIVQKIRAALAFWVKEYMGYHLIYTQENHWKERAIARLSPNENVKILGDTSGKRQPILSFLIHTMSLDRTDVPSGVEVCKWQRTATCRRDKPLHCGFVTKLLNDLFGIQARGGWNCAGPYGHLLLQLSNQQSVAIRSYIQMGYNGLRPGWTRVSFSYYMSVTEFEFLLTAIEFVAVYGQRFLPLYHFNWKTGDWTFKKTALQKLVCDDQALALNCLKLGGTRMLGDQGYHSESSSTPLNQTHGNGIGGRSGPGMEHKYALYLETARYVARLLPKFPPSRQVPEGVDPDHVIFWI